VRLKEGDGCKGLAYSAGKVTFTAKTGEIVFLFTCERDSVTIDGNEVTLAKPDF
jgi:hypothetical protein